MADNWYNKGALWGAGIAAALLYFNKTQNWSIITKIHEMITPLSNFLFKIIPQTNTMAWNIIHVALGFGIGYWIYKKWR